MTQVFNKNNLKEVLDKKPLICYYSENGACGPSGLFLTVFQDHSCYAYSTYYKKSDKQLIHDIIEHVPELRCLIGLDDVFNFQRKRYVDEYDFFYLGLGNWTLLHHSVVSPNEHAGGQYYFPCFKELIRKQTNEDIQSIYEQVRSSING